MHKIGKLGLTVVVCVMFAGMTVNAGSAGKTIHSAVQSAGVGKLLDSTVDAGKCLAAAEDAKEERKKIYGYERCV